jgi:ABC-type microcin C transport system duplicated ATPase subunit YejF
MNDVLLEVCDLKVWFPVKKGLFARTVGHVKAVDGVSFDLRRGETLGVVGESGCGKSTTARAILRLNRPCGGSIRLDGQDILHLRGNELAAYRRRVQVVFQDPQASLNPRHTVRDILTEGMVCHGLCAPADRTAKATELLERVGLDAAALDRYPHEFSGGQRQRICIARAIALKPELLICDEAVSALDLSLRAQVLDLLDELKKGLGLSLLFITHDVGVVQHVADRIIVMNGGKIVEQGDCDTVLRHPQERYTRRLLASVPKIGRPLSEAIDEGDATADGAEKGGRTCG